MADNIQLKLLSILLGAEESEEITALKKALAEAIRKLENPARISLSPEQQRQILPQLFDRLNVPHNFTRGQIVRWKTGLRHRVIPAPDQLAIVLEVLPNNVVDERADSNNTNFREPLNICLGVVGPLGDLIPYWFDRRRFEPAV